MTKFTPIIIAASLFFSAAAHADIEIATVGPMTGADASDGDQLRRGAEQAVADINAKGGLLGQKLKLSIGDDVCDPKQAVSVANQMASKGVLFVAGHYCSSASIPASEVYADAGILQITPASTSPLLTEGAAAKGITSVYRTCGRDDQQGKVGTDYLIQHYRGQPIAVVDDRSTYGKGLADEVRKNLKAAGQTIVVDEEITAGEKDFSALISKMNQAKVSVIYFGGYQTEAGLIVRQARDQKLNARLMTGDSLASADFWQITGPAGNGSLFTFAADPQKEPVAKAVVAELKAKGLGAEGYTLYNYAAVQVFVQAVQKANSLKLGDIVKAMHSTTFDTVIGPITYDAKGDILGGSYIVWEWKNGNFQPLAL